MELQRGICGDLAAFPALRDEVTGDVARNAGHLVSACRQAGATVVHCTFSLRSDRAGTRLDLPLMSAARKDPHYLLDGSESTQLIPELSGDPTDLVCNRHHGVSPFTGTSLHDTLCARGVDTLLVTGVSLNVGIPGLVIEAVNLGYVVVVAKDAVAGFPHDYAMAVLDNTLAAISRVESTNTIIDSL